jgi:phage terminase large subunit-like protein
MPRTVEEIEVDIKAVKANPNWAVSEAFASLYAELLKEKNKLTQAQVPPPSGKY